MASILRFVLPKRKTALDANRDELDRALVERSKRYKDLADARQRWVDADNAVHELNIERSRLMDEMRRRADES